MLRCALLGFSSRLLHNNAVTIEIEQLLRNKHVKIDKINSYKKKKSYDFVLAEISRPTASLKKNIESALSDGFIVFGLYHCGKSRATAPFAPEGTDTRYWFSEGYTVRNVQDKISEVVAYSTFHKKRKGSFVVIDGGDGSGKTTQLHLLQDYCIRNNIATHVVDFPQYYTSFHGQTVARFLRGEFGTIDQVSPYLASLTYALDRQSVRGEMERALIAGEVLLANRYAPSNMAHQGSKFSSSHEQKRFLDWVDELEYRVLKIPREDVVVYLHVPAAISVRLAAHRKGRAYLGSQDTDIHEDNFSHLEKTEKMYLSLCRRNAHWVRIACVDAKGNLYSRAHIHRAIVSALEKRGILPVLDGE